MKMLKYQTLRYTEVQHQQEHENWCAQHIAKEHEEDVDDLTCATLKAVQENVSNNLSFIFDEPDCMKEAMLIHNLHQEVGIASFEERAMGIQAEHAAAAIFAGTRTIWKQHVEQVVQAFQFAAKPQHRGEKKNNKTISMIVKKRRRI